MIRPAALLKRSLIFVHRWLGIALSVVFMLWFPSGIVMMYWGMPSASGGDRLERAPVLDAAQIKLSPEEAYATLLRDQPPTSVTLSSFDGRPVYRFAGGGGGGRGAAKGGAGGGGGRRGAPGGGQTVVYADDGTQQTKVGDAMIDRVASAWAKLPLSEGTKESMKDPDQWTIEGRLRTLRPLYKYSFNDGQQVYVSGDAQVVQYTTSQERFWAYIGVIPHWLYWTPFRVYQPVWFKFVVYSSLIGTGAAILGIIVGIWMYSPAKKYRHAGAPTSIPYKGQKRWHTIFGLVFGLGAATWAFSGYLSMGPFDWVQSLTDFTVGPSDQAKGKGKGKGGGGPRGVNIAGALRGQRAELDAYAAKDPRVAIKELGDFKPKEIEFTTYAGEPIYMATNAAGDTKIVPIEGGVQSRFDPDDLMSLIRENGGGQLADLRIMDEYDAYYLDRRGERPLPVIYAEVNDTAHTRYYVDVKTARVAGTYSSRNWVNRWLYHGLHSMDFPWLYKYRPLWDIVVIMFMVGGTALCVTSLILSWRVLKRKLSVLLPTENLPTEEPSAATESQSVSV